MQYIDIQCSQLWKADIIVTSLHVIKPLCGQSYFAFPLIEWEVQTQKKCPFSLNRVVASIEVTATNIM